MYTIRVILALINLPTTQVLHWLPLWSWQLNQPYATVGNVMAALQKNLELCEERKLAIFTIVEGVYEDEGWVVNNLGQESTEAA